MNNDLFWASWYDAKSKQCKQIIKKTNNYENMLSRGTMKLKFKVRENCEMFLTIKAK